MLVHSRRLSDGLDISPTYTVTPPLSPSLTAHQGPHQGSWKCLQGFMQPGLETTENTSPGDSVHVCQHSRRRRSRSSMNTLVSEKGTGSHRVTLERSGDFERSADTSETSLFHRDGWVLACCVVLCCVHTCVCLMKCQMVRDGQKPPQSSNPICFHSCQMLFACVAQTSGSTIQVLPGKVHV